MIEVLNPIHKITSIRALVLALVLGCYILLLVLELHKRTERYIMSRQL